MNSGKARAALRNHRCSIVARKREGIYPKIYKEESTT